MDQEIILKSNMAILNDVREGGIVCRRNMMSLKNFMVDVTNKYNNVQDEVLPLNCRLAQTLSNGNKIIIVEDSPKIRTCTFRISFDRIIEEVKAEGNLERFGFENFRVDEDTMCRLRLSMPYIVYIFLLSPKNECMSLYIGFRLSPISSIYDYLITPCLLNIAEELEVCLEHTYDYEHAHIISLTETVEDIINVFWSNPFNFDYLENYKKYKDIPELKNPLAWAYYTKVDPMFIYNINKWKKHKGNIKSLIKHINYPYHSDYRWLSNLFQTTRVTEAKPGLDYKTNILSYIINGISVEVGDQIKFKNGKEWYVDSFSVENTSRYIEPEAIDITHINLDIGNGKIRRFKLTLKFRHLLFNLIKQNNLLSTAYTSNHTKIKKEDIVAYDIGGISRYGLIRKIRRALDGKEEIKMLSTWYLAESMDLKLVDSENMNYRGRLLKRDVNYYILKDKKINSFGILDIKNRYKYKGIKLYNKELFLLFQHGTEDQLISINSNDKQIVEEGKLKRIQSPIIIGDKLIEGVMYEYEDYILSLRYDYTSVEKLVKKNCLTPERFSVNGFKFNIEFKVGDSVIVPNWSNPLDMLKIKKIVKIYYHQEIIYFDMRDRDGNLTTIEYYKNKLLAVGAVRRISLIHKNIKTGFKIKAKEIGIPMFPKKDINFIIGFITDVDLSEPLVLCSNCCTLTFYDVLNKFEIITKPDKRRHAKIEIKKIKPQINDLVICNDSICKIVKDKRLIKIQYIGSSRFSHAVFSYKFEKELIKFYGLLNPRQKLNQLSFSNDPNMHNEI